MIIGGKFLCRENVAGAARKAVSTATSRVVAQASPGAEAKYKVSF